MTLFAEVLKLQDTTNFERTIYYSEEPKVKDWWAISQKVKILITILASVFLFSFPNSTLPDVREGAQLYHENIEACKEIVKRLDELESLQMQRQSR